MGDFSQQWSLTDPSSVLLKLTVNKELSVNSSDDAENLIIKNPEDIYVLVNILLTSRNLGNG